MTELDKLQKEIADLRQQLAERHPLAKLAESQQDMPTEIAKKVIERWNELLDSDEYPDVPHPHHNAPVVARFVDKRQAEQLEARIKELEARNEELKAFVVAFKAWLTGNAPLNTDVRQLLRKIDSIL